LQELAYPRCRTISKEHLEPGVSAQRVWVAETDDLPEQAGPPLLYTGRMGRFAEIRVYFEMKSSDA